MCLDLFDIYFAVPTQNNGIFDVFFFVKHSYTKNTTLPVDITVLFIERQPSAKKSPIATDYLE